MVKLKKERELLVNWGDWGKNSEEMLPEEGYLSWNLRDMCELAKWSGESLQASESMEHFRSWRKFDLAGV